MQSVSQQWWRRTSAGAGSATLTSLAEHSAPRGSTPAFAALMAFVVVSMLAPPPLAALHLALLTAVVTTVALFVNRLVSRRRFATWAPETWVAASLAGWAIATVPFSYWPGGSVVFLLDMYFKTLAAFWLVGTIVDTRARFQIVAWTLSLAAVPPAVTAVRNFLAGVFIIEGRSVRIVGSEGLFYANPHDLALLLDLILPLTVALLLMARGRLVRLLLAGIVLVDVLAVIVTFSRAGFLVLATTFGLYCWRLSKRAGRGWAVVAIVLALAALPLLPSGYVDRLSTITSIESDPTGSAQLRWTDMFAAVGFVLAHPIVGP